MSNLQELARLLREEKQKDSLKIYYQEPEKEEPQNAPEPVSLPTVHPDINVEKEPVVGAVIKPQTYNPIIEKLQAKELELLKRHVDDLGKRISQVASSTGGGASSLNNIDRPVRTISSNYSITTRDWYIGVASSQSTGRISVTLPSRISNGYEFVVKDETGNCEYYPITIIGEIDNKQDVEMRVNNSSITLLYNNGWRII